MPIYEFYCPTHHRIHSFYARTLAMAGKIPRCPEGGGAALVRQPSRFAVTGRHKERDEAAGADDPFGDIDEATMERLAGEFEKEFAGDAEPDPRAMGRMMRRMAEITGKQFAGPLAEMVERLEKGEDPEALEESFGGALDDESVEWFENVKRLGRGGAPARDKVIHEMADYVD